MPTTTGTQSPSLDPLLRLPQRRPLSSGPLARHDLSRLFGEDVSTSMAMMHALRTTHLARATLEELVEVCYEDMFDNSRVVYELLRQPEASVEMALHVCDAVARSANTWRVEHLLVSLDHLLEEARATGLRADEEGYARAEQLYLAARAHLDAVPAAFSYLRLDAARIRAKLTACEQECFDMLLASRTSEADPGSYLRDILAECVADARNILEA